MAESLPTLVWGARPDGSCDFVSQQWVDYTGLSEAALLGYRWLDPVHPDDRERVRGEWKAAVAARTALNAEFRICSKEGSFRWFKARSVPIRDERGDLVKWYGTNSDVDDLKHTTERLSSILDGINEPFFALDDDLTVTYFNAAAERVLERRREDLLGKSLFDAFPEAASSVFEERYRQAIRERRAFSFDARFERAPYQGWYSVRVYPHAHGISVFFQRRDQAPPAGGTGGRDS